MEESKKISIAFYKSTKGIFGPLIRFKQYYLQRIPYRHAQFSHVELVFDGNECFSSSESDGGVRFKEIDLESTFVSKSGLRLNKWVKLEIDLTKSQYDRCYAWAKSQTGNKYNWLGIFFAQGLNFNIRREGDWFCSEICLRCLQEAGMFCGENSLFTTPAKLKKLVEDFTRK